MEFPSPPRRGISLIEVLIVLAILATLLALIVPAVLNMRASAARAQCMSQLRQIGLACHLANNQNKRLPPASGLYPGNEDDFFSGTNGFGNVFFHLLPFIDQEPLYRQSHYRAPPLPPGIPGMQTEFLNSQVIKDFQIAIYNCPSDPTLKPGTDPTRAAAPSSYAANYQVFGIVDDNFATVDTWGRAQIPGSFADGVSHTILFAEKYASASITAAANKGVSLTGGCHWAYFQGDCHNPTIAYYHPGTAGNPPDTDPNSVGPKDAADPRDGRFQIRPNPAGGCNPCLPATGHAAMNSGMADGSVRSLDGSIDRFVWWALLTPAGSELIHLLPWPN